MDIVPRVAGTLTLNRRRWKLPLQTVTRFTVAAIQPKRLLPSYESQPMLTGLEMFGSFPTAVVAMHRSKINVCATVGSRYDLAETAIDYPAKDMKHCILMTLRFSLVPYSVSALNCLTFLSFIQRWELVKRPSSRLEPISLL